MRLHALYINKHNRKDDTTFSTVFCLCSTALICLFTSTTSTYNTRVYFKHKTFYRNNLSYFLFFYFFFCLFVDVVAGILFTLPHFLCKSQWYCLSGRSQSHTIWAVYQISLGRHLSRMQCLTVYKSTRFACEIKKSYLILCEIKFQMVWLARITLLNNIYIFFFPSSIRMYYLLQCKCYFTCSHFSNYIMFYNWIDRLNE